MSALFFVYWNLSSSQITFPLNNCKRQVGIAENRKKRLNNISCHFKYSTVPTELAERNLFGMHAIFTYQLAERPLWRKGQFITILNFKTLSKPKRKKRRMLRPIRKKILSASHGPFKKKSASPKISKLPALSHRNMEEFTNKYGNEFSSPNIDT
jgi:hypothetical protein